MGLKPVELAFAARAEERFRRTLVRLKPRNEEEREDCDEVLDGILRAEVRYNSLENLLLQAR